MSARRRARAAMAREAPPEVRPVDSGARARFRTMSLDDWIHLLEASHPAADFADSLARARDLRARGPGPR